MEKIIGIKQLHQQLKQISQETLQGQSFIVIKNAKPVFKIEPIAENRQKKYALNDLVDLQFKNNKNLSKNIDNVIY